MTMLCPVCKKQATSVFRKLFGQTASLFCRNCEVNLHIPINRNYRTVIVSLLVIFVSTLFTDILIISFILGGIVATIMAYKEPYIEL